MSSLTTILLPPTSNLRSPRYPPPEYQGTPSPGPLLDLDPSLTWTAPLNPFSCRRSPTRRPCPFPQNLFKCVLRQIVLALIHQQLLPQPSQTYPPHSSTSPSTGPSSPSNFITLPASAPVSHTPATDALVNPRTGVLSWPLLSCAFRLEPFIRYPCGLPPSLHSDNPSGVFPPAQPAPLSGAVFPSLGLT